MSRSQPHILLIQLEFPTWAQARAWTYPACFGVAEGLRANGVTCTTVPLLANASFSTESWLEHARQSVAGQRFDQVWVWLVHSPLDPKILDWITGLAPVRVGIVMESLTYEEEDYAWAPQLRARQGLVENQLRAFTHALLPDECDVRNGAERKTIQVLWWPPMVPARFIVSQDKPAVHRRGVFHGDPYGARRRWVTDASLQQHLSFVRPAAPHTHVQQLFDHLQMAISKRLAGRIPMTREQMGDYAGTLQQIREAEFTEWMAQLPQWAAIVNLPSLAKFFGGRVYEGIAAGRPVLSYAVPEHPLNNALFTEGAEILFFSPESPDSLKDQLERVIRDEAFGATLARNAQRKLRAYHTSEHRIAQTLAWIESGQQPDYGLGALLERSVEIHTVIETERGAQSEVAAEASAHNPDASDSTSSAPETNYRRYKMMGEKDMRRWSLLTGEIRKNAQEFRETGDLGALFALLGVTHGVIDALRNPDCEEDVREHEARVQEIVTGLFTSLRPKTHRRDPATHSGQPPTLGEPPSLPQPAPTEKEESMQRSAQKCAGSTAIESDDKERQQAAPSAKSPEVAMDHDRFYVNMFVNSPAWSTPEPNSDEAARWSKIASFLEHILRRVTKDRPDATLRMLEVGCGRGWLSNLASQYGTVEGVEPVAGVVAHARRMFPHLRFETGTAETVLKRADFRPYDVVLCSEVIEHVPNPQKPAFVDELKQLLTPEGYVILTTPRGEMWDRWKAIAPPCQPVEDWITEQHLDDLLTAQGFTPLGVERIYVEIPALRYIPAPTPYDLKNMNLLPIYQVWVAQRTAQPAAVPGAAVNRAPKVTVIIPTHNRPDRLRAAISSVLGQNYQDFNIVVVNDGSIAVEAIVAELNHEGRITLITHDRNRGLAASRNTGLRHATGKYVCYLDDDDRLLPNHLDTLVTCLESSDHKVAYTDAWRVHERVIGDIVTEVNRDCPYSMDFNPHQLLIGNYIPVLCVMHERACLDDVGVFDESLFVHEDWDFWIRMATRYPFVHIPKTTGEFTWRIDGSSMTSHDQEAFLRTTEIIYQKYAPYAANLPAVREAQRARFQELRARHVKQAKSAFTCSIIIPVWNKVALTRQCLEALAATTTEVSFEVIVVDNGSTDETPQFLSALGGDVRVITNETNMGFAKACNQGAAAATGDYLVFLNNDTIPLDGWLSALVEEVTAHPEVAVVGSKLLFQDRTVQHAGVAVDRLHRSPYHIYRGFADTHPAVNKRRELNAVTAACLLIRRNMFTEVGGFDEGFLNGFEDVDLCFKVREKKGRIVYQPRSVLFHLESQTPGRKQYDAENGRRLRERWGHDWWLVDDDSIYFDDGYKVIVREQDGRLVPHLQLIDTEKERLAWELVAVTQRAAQQRDEASVAVPLSKCDDWPADRWVLKWAASVAEAVKQPALAAAFTRRVSVLDDPAADQIAAIREALSKGQVTTAASRLESLLKHYPSHAEGLLLRAILHMQQEQYRDAEIAFTTALNQGADRRKCLMGIGMASMGRAYPQGAWQTFLRVLAENPDDAEVIHWLLRAGTAQNRWEELSTQLRNYLARNPGDISVRFAYAGVLLRGDQIEAARREYSQLQVLASEHEGIRELGQAIAGKEAVLAMGALNA